MKCAVLYYNGFGQFEVSVALSSLSPRAEIIGLALEKKPIFSEDKQLFLPQMQIGEIAAEDVDVLLVPGGDILPLLDNPELGCFLQGVNRQRKIIAAISGGVMLLGHYGLLKGKCITGVARESGFDSIESGPGYAAGAMCTGEEVAVDGNLITATGQAFIEFGIEVAAAAGIYRDEREKNRKYCWYKNRRIPVLAIGRKGYMSELNLN